MANTRQPTFINQSVLNWKGSKVRQSSYTDISPELVLEAMTRVEVGSRVNGKAPKESPLTDRFRKRLANVREK